MLTNRKVVLSGASGMALLGAFFAGQYFARAAQGGASAPTIAFAGNLRRDGQPYAGPVDLTFSFKKSGSVACAPKVLGVNVDQSSGAFVASIPLETCPSSLFDGSDITFDISVGSTIVASDQPVAPVPYAKYADVAGSPDCPAGYARDNGVTKYVVCAKAGDELVKVGIGNSAFWVDRYEASVWTNPDGTGTQLGTQGYDYPASFPANGQWTAAVYAVSKAGVVPSGFLNWFQAAAACRANGKRLPTTEEWLTAARGTADPGDNAGANGTCLTRGSEPPRTTGLGTNCISASGAQDMIGNVWEYTSEWFTAAAPTTEQYPAPVTPYPSSFNGDATINAGGAAKPANGSAPVAGLPAAGIHGGSLYDGTQAGIFSLALNNGVTDAYNTFGFRCIVPR